MAQTQEHFFHLKFTRSILAHMTRDMTRHKTLNMRNQIQRHFIRKKVNSEDHETSDRLETLKEKTKRPTYRGDMTT